MQWRGDYQLEEFDKSEFLSLSPDYPLFQVFLGKYLSHESNQPPAEFHKEESIPVSRESKGQDKALKLTTKAEIREERAVLADEGESKFCEEIKHETDSNNNPIIRRRLPFWHENK